jgi:SHS2 domain-containing protein
LKTPETPVFEELEHTADLRLQVRGRDLGELFVHAAQGMFALMRCHVEAGARAFMHEVHLSADDREMLLVDWLSELLYMSERDRVCMETFEVNHLRETELDAHVEGRGPARAERGIKAVTFSDLTIEHTSSGSYITTITFDV